MSAPNVLLVVFDTARRDAVEPFGGPRAATPALAQLASRGGAFEHAYANCSWTLPSHASMFTGLLPRRLGLTQAPDGMHSVRPVMDSFAERLLPTVLKRSGYRTQGWVTNHWVSRYTGFDIGFDDFVLVDSDRVGRMEALLSGGRRAQLAWAWEGIASRHDDGAAEVGRRLGSAIRSWDGTPSFWFVNLTECHSPYLPPRPWSDLPALERARAALDVARHLNFLAICLYVCGRRDITAETFQRMEHLYRRAISYMDSWMAGVLETLDERGILDDTLVIVTSDHGENFGEDGLIAHGCSLDQRLVNVPLVMAGPGTPDCGRVISLAELPGVIAAAAGIDDAPWTPDELPEGLAVAQYDPIGTLESPKIQEFGATYGLSDRDLEPLCAEFTAVTDGHLKLVTRDGVESVYDLDRDPAEHAPLTDAQRGPQVDRLRCAHRHTAVAGPPPPPAAMLTAAAPQDAPSEDEVAAIERQMKLLGYM